MVEQTDQDQVNFNIADTKNLDLIDIYLYSRTRSVVGGANKDATIYTIGHNSTRLPNNKNHVQPYFTLFSINMVNWLF